MKKKVLLPAFFLALALCLGLLCAPAFADYDPDVWDISEDGVLNYYNANSEETDLVIPDVVTAIGPAAFKNKSNITSVVIPEGIKAIPESTFEGCTSLTRVTIPNSVQTIGWGAFQNCSSLASITIPEGVKIIPNNAFYGCTKLATISLPSTLTAINFNAFHNSGLVSIDIPEGVTTIGDQAFYDCDKLETVSFPNTLTQIGDSAFYSCSSLTSVDIPDSVYNLGDGVFMHCTSLTSVALSYANIPARTFYNCTNLATITLREGVRTIGDSAFADCTNVAVLILPSTISSIGTWAFSILGDVYYAGSEADWNRVSFDQNKNYALAHANFHFNSTGPEPEYPSGKCGDDLTWILKDGTLTISGSGEMYEFEYSYSGGDVGAETDVPWYDFADSITAVKIGDGVTSIGSYAFVDCFDLASVNIPNGIASIGGKAFFNCLSLIGDVTIPDSVTNIGDAAFANCRLNSINVAPGNPTYTSEGGVLFNKDKTVLHTCPTGKSGAYSIPNSVTSIADYAFYFCANLTSIIIPDSVTSIGDVAFSDCTSLASVTLGKGVTSIGEYAFEGCPMTSITIPDSVTSISAYAFVWCGLTSVTIPYSVAEIGKDAFLGTKLEDVYYAGTEKEWEAIDIASGNDPLTSANIHYITPFSVSLGSNAATVQVVDERNTLKSCTTVYAARYEDGRMVELVAGKLSGNSITFSKALTKDYVLFFLDGRSAPVREKATLSTAN